MLTTVRSFTLDGISARPVQVEVDIHCGLPSFSIVGLPDAAVREARERVRAALLNAGFEFPPRRIVVNLAPASPRKAGPGLDLAIAAAILVASGQLAGDAFSRIAMVGELALDGSVRPVPGVFPIAEAAYKGGADAIAVPLDNGAEAALVNGIGVITLESIRSLAPLVAGKWRPPRPEPWALHADPSPRVPDFADLRGQLHLRHVLEVAAAGAHSLLMIGSPGCGKIFAATRLPSILPPLCTSQAREVARIASVCRQKFAGRPFRAPHHTISPSGLVGSDVRPCPGEVTLAQGSVLLRY